MNAEFGVCECGFRVGTVGHECERAIVVDSLSANEDSELRDASMTIKA